MGRKVEGPEDFHIIGRAFGFLQAENVGFFKVQVFQKILSQRCPEAIHIPGNQFHNQKHLGDSDEGKATNFESIPWWSSNPLARGLESNTLNTHTC